MKANNIKVGDIVTNKITKDKWLVFEIQPGKTDMTTILLCLANDRTVVRRVLRGAFSAIYTKTKK
jgi:hypothetical protein